MMGWFGTKVPWHENGAATPWIASRSFSRVDSAFLMGSSGASLAAATAVLGRFVRLVRTFNWPFTKYTKAVGTAIPSLASAATTSWAVAFGFAIRIRRIFRTC